MPLVLHYRGDRRALDNSVLVGPDMGGGFLKPVSADYDPRNNRTTVTFQHLLREKWPPQAIVLAGKVLHDKLQLLYAEARWGSRKALDRLGITAQVAAIHEALEKP